MSPGLMRPGRSSWTRRVIFLELVDRDRCLDQNGSRLAAGWCRGLVASPELLAKVVDLASPATAIAAPMISWCCGSFVQHGRAAPHLDAGLPEREPAGVDALRAVAEDEQTVGSVVASGPLTSARTSCSPTRVRSCASSMIAARVPRAARPAGVVAGSEDDVGEVDACPAWPSRRPTPCISSHTCAAGGVRIGARRPCGRARGTCRASRCPRPLMTAVTSSRRYWRLKPSVGRAACPGDTIRL